ncbi:MAG: hypothetical protein VX800_02665 [Chloroflexota bacterium]|nr:hypothetical protein [Chloroflexota bacterium]
MRESSTDRNMAYAYIGAKSKVSGNLVESSIILDGSDQRLSALTNVEVPVP